MKREKIIAKLNSIFGKDHVISEQGLDSLNLKDKWPIQLDKWPANLFHMKDAELPRIIAVVRPNRQGHLTQLKNLVNLALSYAPELKLVTRGGGSGVCGAANTSGDEIIIDTRELNDITILRAPSLSGDIPGMIQMQSGVRGGDIDRELKSKNPRLTLGQYPASYHISTVGGWVSTDASGQFSIRYGKMANLVTHASGIDGLGRNSTFLGKNLKKIVGLEGTTAIITEVNMPVFRIPPIDGFLSFTLPHIDRVEAFIRQFSSRISDIEKRYSVEIFALRFYDWMDKKFIAKPHKGDTYESPWIAGIKYKAEKFICYHHSALFSAVRFLERQKKADWLGLLYMAGKNEELLERAKKEIYALAEGFGGCNLGPEISQLWYANRFKMSYEKLIARFERGLMADTFDCTPGPKNLVDTYEAIRRVCFDKGIAGAHIGIKRSLENKLYPYFYFTLAVPKEESLYHSLRQDLLETCVRYGARTQSHHNIGKWRSGNFNSLVPWAHGMDWLTQAIHAKRELDPHNILNPGNIFHPSWL